MRMMIRWQVPAEQGNVAIKDGTMGKMIEQMLRDLKPEAAYFHADCGLRAGTMVFDMTDPSQIPQIAEPLFQAFNAEVEFFPVMNVDDLRKALERVSS
jgi:Domain of unknown function (DUF3303)